MKPKKRPQTLPRYQPDSIYAAYTRALYGRAAFLPDRPATSPAARATPSTQEPANEAPRRVVAGAPSEPPQTRINSGDERGGFAGHAVDLEPSHEPRHQGRYGLKGGRPRIHATDTARQTAAKRAYRARQKQLLAAVNDSVLVELPEAAR